MDPEKKKQKLSTSPGMPNSSLTKTDVREAMKKQNDVAMLLTGKVISTVAKNSNFVFSPTSINAVLTMLAATSDKEKLKSFILSFLKSSSMDELNAVFREIGSVVLADGSTSGGPKIAAINGVWIEQSLPSPSWKDFLVDFFKAEFSQVDFRSKAEEVCNEVNSWASENTNGLIKDLLPGGSVTRETDWIYGNALYFKGAWHKKFDKSMTKDKPFYLLNDKSVNVPFMRSRHKNQYVKVYDDFKVLRLPYEQGRDDTNRGFSMYFYLPDKKDGFDNLLERMTSTNGFLDSHIPISKERVGSFGIPKFKISFGFEASTVFDDLELESSLYHKACVEIDEEGTEAAAATSGRGGGSRHPPKSIDFVADHPFLFLIREDKTGTVLFAGQIFDPSN